MSWWALQDRTCDPCRVNSQKRVSTAYASLASSRNHDGPTAAYNGTDEQVLARFGRGLAAFLLHEPARLLGVREVAGVLGVSAPIHRLCARGEIVHVRVSNAIRISPQAVIDYLTDREP